MDRDLKKGLGEGRARCGGGSGRDEWKFNHSDFFNCFSGLGSGGLAHNPVHVKKVVKV